MAQVTSIISQPGWLTCAAVAITAIWASCLIAEPAVDHLRELASVSSHRGGKTALIGGPISGLSPAVFARTNGETDIRLIGRLNKLIHETTWHCEPSDFHLSKMEERLLDGRSDIFDQGILVRSRFTCGFCHQRAFLLQEALTASGVSAEVHGLNGHVVVKAVVDGVHYYSDPDYGVGPFTADAVREAYAPIPWADVGLIQSMYASLDDNGTYAGDASYLSVRREAQRELFWRSSVESWLRFGLAGAILFLGLFVAGLSVVPPWLRLGA